MILKKRIYRKTVNVNESWFYVLLNERRKNLSWVNLHFQKEKPNGKLYNREGSWVVISIKQFTMGC